MLKQHRENVKILLCVCYLYFPDDNGVNVENPFIYGEFWKSITV